MSDFFFPLTSLVNFSKTLHIILSTPVLNFCVCSTIRTLLIYTSFDDLGLLSRSVHFQTFGTENSLSLQSANSLSIQLALYSILHASLCKESPETLTW